jgi:transcription antitermination protein NusB
MASRRSQARRYALLALYQWQVTGQSPSEIGRHFLHDPIWMGEVADSLALAAEEGPCDDPEQRVYDHDLFGQLLSGVPGHVQELDALLQPLLDRRVEQVDPVERAVLRLGAYELVHCPEIPYRVVINEAVDLAKAFGAEQGHRYVNGVLDKIARQVRGGEMGSSSAAR